MTRLELVKALARFLGTEDPDNITDTTTVADYQSDLVVAIDTAYEEIQTKHVDWLWRRKAGSFATVDGTREYAFSDIDSDCIGILPMIGGQQFSKYCLISTHEVGFVPWQNFNGWLNRGTRPENKPQYITVQPDETIELDPTPDAAYTVTVDYLNDIEVFSADADTPDMPTRYHRVIVYRAAMYMSEYDENMTRFGMAKERYHALMNKLKADQLPDQDIAITPVGRRRLY